MYMNSGANDLLNCS